MYDKRGFEFSFAWLFSIIIGGVIIFLAIYFSTNLIKNEIIVQNTLNSKELEILLQPLETQSFETSIKPKVIQFPDETRLEIDCSYQKPFGYSKVKTSTRQRIGEEWQEGGVGSTLNNKYIFGEKVLESKDFEIFTQQLTMPFKIGDLTFIWSGEYCFVNAPSYVDEDFNSLGINESIQIVESVDQCKAKSKKVCFGAGTLVSSCDISVDTNLERVKKQGRFVYYKGPLIYGAIFSDVDNYDCNIKRIMIKAGSLAGVYYDKSSLIASRSDNSCSIELQPLLKTYADRANINSSKNMQEVYIDFNELYNLAGELDDSQGKLICSLWKEEFRK
ncbi:MAG: hypothetical protein AABX35_00560 [Nanoarchaeota archaeon]